MNYRSCITTLHQHLCFVKLEWPEFRETESQLVYLENLFCSAAKYFCTRSSHVPTLFLAPSKVFTTVHVTHKLRTGLAESRYRVQHYPYPQLSHWGGLPILGPSLFFPPRAAHHMSACCSVNGRGQRISEIHSTSQLTYSAQTVLRQKF